MLQLVLAMVDNFVASPNAAPVCRRLGERFGLRKLMLIEMVMFTVPAVAS